MYSYFQIELEAILALNPDVGADISTVANTDEQFSNRVGRRWCRKSAFCLYFVVTVHVRIWMQPGIIYKFLFDFCVLYGVLVQDHT